MATSKHLDQVWRERHSVYYDREQKKITGEAKTSICHDLGMCVCGKADGSSPESLWLWENLKQFFKKWFWKKQKKPSPLRKLLEERRIVVQFEAAQPDLDHELEAIDTDTVHADSSLPETLPKDLWFCPAFLHYGNWHFAALQLFGSNDCPKAATASDKFQMLDVGTDSQAADRVLNDVKLFKTLVNFDFMWSFWQISDREELWTMDNSSACVPVVPCDCEQFFVWAGLLNEAGRRGRPSRKRKAGPMNIAPGGQKKQRGHKLQNNSDPLVFPALPDQGNVQDGEQQLDSLEASFDLIESMFDDEAAEGSDDAKDDHMAFMDALAASVPNTVNTDAAAAVAPASELENPGNEMNLAIGKDKDQDASDIGSGLDVCDAFSLFEFDFDPVDDDDEVDLDDEDGGSDDGAAGPPATPAAIHEEPQNVPAAGDGASAASSGSAGISGTGNGNSGNASIIESLPGPRESTAAAKPTPKAKAVSSSRAETNSLDLGTMGVIRYNPLQQAFVAVCNHPGHGDCRLTRTAKASKASGGKSLGQGRPLGLLYDWLDKSTDFATQAMHLHSFVTTRAFREQARVKLKAKAGAVQFSNDFERAKRDGENSEPEHIR